MLKLLTATSAAALLMVGGAANAQTADEPSRGAQENRIGSILGTLFGDRLGVSTSIENQWAIGRKPLATQRAQFVARIDADVRAGSLTQTNGARMKSEYDQLVELETRYGADGRFTTQERTDLGDRYGALTQALTEGGFAEPVGTTTLTVANGRGEFERRIDASLAARRLSRVQATRLRTDYADLVRIEAGYARDGISDRERDDLDARLDALDARVGDVAFGGTPVALDMRTRLANIERASPTSGLGTVARAQLLVEHGDLRRLDDAYTRSAPTAEERAYLERRIGNLEARARVRR